MSVKDYGLCLRTGCGTPLNRHQHKFCSVACCNIAATRDRGTCEICGKQLLGRQTRVCSRACAAALNAGKGKHGQAFRDELARLWAEGIYCEAIAARLGVTKNVVVGLRKRMRLPPRPSPIIKNGDAVPSGTPNETGERRLRDSGLSIDPGVGRAGSAAAPAPSHVVLFASPRTCQFITNADPKRPQFCGKEAEADRPYCLACCRVAYLGYVPHRQRAAA